MDTALALFNATPPGVADERKGEGAGGEGCVEWRKRVSWISMDDLRWLCRGEGGSSTSGLADAATTLPPPPALPPVVLVLVGATDAGPSANVNGYGRWNRKFGKAAPVRQERVSANKARKASTGNY